MIRILADMPGDAERINAAIGGAGRLLDVARGFNADDADIDCLIVGCRRQCPREMLELLREIAVGPPSEHSVGARLGLHRSTLNRKARTWPG
ncbi:hypothetical protein, partial [Candidatus Palauibacter sp.]|uniref:hypothetical protein n=1 Tax=Candidatus Palauibacter sp. TaxID=3101350 RepID=UPI003AF2BDA2